MATEIQNIADEAYREFMDASIGVVPVGDAREAVEAALLEAIERGDISSHEVHCQWVRQYARITDTRQTDFGKGIIRKVATGQMPMNALLGDVYCPLGKGERVLFGNIKLATLLQAEQTRYEEKRASDIAYDDWKRLFNRLAPVLERTGLSVSEAYALGHIDMNGEEEAADD